jgi:hypothetical protein
MANERSEWYSQNGKRKSYCSACGHSSAMHVHTSGGCWQQVGRDAGGQVKLCTCRQFTQDNKGALTR